MIGAGISTLTLSPAVRRTVLLVLAGCALFGSGYIAGCRKVPLAEWLTLKANLRRWTRARRRW